MENLFKLFHRGSKRTLITVVAFLAMLIALPLTFYLTQNQQDLRQQAAVVSQVCEDTPADIALIMDRSGSMGSLDKMPAAKLAASTFTDNIAQEPDNRLSLVSYSTSGTLDSPLTNNFSAIKTKINSFTPSGITCISCGIFLANNEFSQNQRSQYKNVMVLLTDGIANAVITSTTSSTSTRVSPSATTTEAENEALQMAKDAVAQNNVVIFVIGLGSNVNDTFLQKLASETGGKYYFSPSAQELTQIYEEISKLTGKGIISGTVYHDVNEDGAKQATEVGLSGWSVSLKDTSGTSIGSETTDTDGKYSFVGLCDGTFDASVTLKADWQATAPVGGSHQVTINQANVVTDVNFGVAEKPAACGATCQDTSDCATATDGCTICNSQTNKCEKPASCGSTCAQDAQCTSARDGCTQCNTTTNKCQTPAACGVTCENNADCGQAQDGCTICNPDTKKCAPKAACGAACSSNAYCQTAGDGCTVCSTQTNKCEPPVACGTACTQDSDCGEAVDGCTFCDLSTNKCAPKAEETVLKVNAKMPGIGNLSGDNPAPNNPNRSAEIEVFDVNNQKIKDGTGTVQFDGTNAYVGTINLGRGFTTGFYYATVRLDNTLRSRVPQVHRIEIGKVTELPLVTLISGDLNQNNILDINDYNIFLGCSNGKTCAQQTLADLNDDGQVQQVDYNILLRAFRTRAGE